MQVPSVPGLISKVAVYFRAQIFPQDTTKSIIASLKTPWGEVVPLGEVKEDLISKTKAAARESNFPYGGVVMRATISPFPIQGFGLMTAVVNVDGEERICAVMNIIPTVDATASSPPASQSPNAS